mmetsp:Transcript_29507/g.74846  ORF Transcript_29507/g.74846 Transcript_29507/m.74846 type:complete len:209 (-) Transcript_29507:1746-2372(-)
MMNSSRASRSEPTLTWRLLSPQVCPRWPGQRAPSVATANSGWKSQLPNMAATGPERSLGPRAWSSAFAAVESAAGQGPACGKVWADRATACHSARTKPSTLSPPAPAAPLHWRRPRRLSPRAAATTSMRQMAAARDTPAWQGTSERRLPQAAATMGMQQREAARDTPVWQRPSARPLPQAAAMMYMRQRTAARGMPVWQGPSALGMPV